MYAVGRLISQGAYTVSGPFHPFGGAVDVVVVQQQDGSLKSSPWYVKFGKFQGLLKANARVVDINVNGVNAGFHMYLDPRGEAYFLREVDSSSLNGNGHDNIGVETDSMNYEFDQCNSVSYVSNGAILTKTNSRRSRILGFGLGKRSVKEQVLSKEENDSALGRMTSLESAEMAADLLDMKWSTNLIGRESRNNDGDVTGGRLEASLVLHEEHFVNKLDSSQVDLEVSAMEVEETEVTDVFNNNVNKDIDETSVSDKSSRSHLENANELEAGLIVPESEIEGSSNQVAAVSDKSSRSHLENANELEAGLIVPESEIEGLSNQVAAVSDKSSRSHLENANELEVGLIEPESEIEDSSNQVTASVKVVSRSSILVPLCQNVDDNLAKQVNETDEIRMPLEPNCDFQVSERVVEEQLIFGDLDDSKPNINKIEEEVKHVVSELTCHDEEHFKGDLEVLKGNFRRCPSNADVLRSSEVTQAEIGRQAKSLPNMWCQFNDPITDRHEDPQFDPPVGKLRSSNWDLLREDPSRIKRANLEEKLQQNEDNLSNELKDGSITRGGPPNADAAGSGRWRWLFRRHGNKNVFENRKKDSNVNAVAATDVEKELCPPKSDKMYTRALTPTSEQLASLNLAEGKNIVTFTFSTSVLGTQTVDARIYLWRWDTRIVISDVDGTITKSDVLGQFMPLVGRDWSHIGVTHLFSAIKENGYQMLYLSARAISQASKTRQFLFNLKQDGKDLPDGPVVISPDGLFPSLFREVIRRVPHEFKIGCLEDIRLCFPSDRNPFYAGFGNRITDEFSYLKVGISKGKIFIINHKGEVVINRSIDSRSYASLHALVNDIFPPVSVHEEEDYNSWNFWKLPPPTIE